jgi:hypothetical protein
MSRGPRVVGGLDVFIGVAECTANEQSLGVEKRHDERLVPSDDEFLASLIRRKHKI